jgi:hypothetical protein
VDETRFANTGFPGNEDHLAEALFTLLPAPPQQAEFLIPPYQQEGSLIRCRLACTAPVPQSTHLPDLQGIDYAFQGLQPKDSRAHASKLHFRPAIRDSPFTLQQGDHLRQDNVIPIEHTPSPADLAALRVVHAVAHLTRRWDGIPVMDEEIRVMQFGFLVSSLWPGRGGQEKRSNSESSIALRRVIPPLTTVLRAV